MGERRTNVSVIRLDEWLWLIDDTLHRARLTVEYVEYPYGTRIATWLIED